MLKEIAAIIIIVTFLLGLYGDWKLTKIDFFESNDRWELIENIDGNWGYWRDKKNLDICTIHSSSARLVPSFAAEAISYIPCNLIKK